MKVGVVNRAVPHGTANGREALDAALALSAMTDNLSVFFLDDGVLQLLPEQRPEAILQRHYNPTFGLFELYDIENIWVCSDSCLERGIDPERLSIPVHLLSKDDFQSKLSEQDYLLGF